MASFKEVLQLSILEHQQDEEVGVWLLRVQVGEDHQLPHGHKLELHVLELVLKRTINHKKTKGAPTCINDQHL
jgi:hypothetical protein